MRKNKGVPEMYFVGRSKCEGAVRTMSTEATLALNPSCFGGRVVYVHRPSTHPLQCKDFHDSLSVPPKLEKKIQKLVIYTPTNSNDLLLTIIRNCLHWRYKLYPVKMQLVPPV
jgi:hypothetical protein